MILKVSKVISKFKKKEILDTFKKTKFAFQNEQIKILISKSNLDFGKVLLIFNRKTGNSPQRNKIKRQARAIFYQEKIYEHKVNFILIGRLDIEKIEFSKLKEIFKYVVSKKINSLNQ